MKMTDTRNLPPTQEDLIPVTEDSGSTAATKPATRASRSVEQKLKMREALLKRPFKSPLKRTLSVSTEDVHEQAVHESSKKHKQDSQQVSLPARNTRKTNSVHEASTSSAVEVAAEGKSSTRAGTAPGTTLARRHHQRVNLPFRSPVVQAAHESADQKRDPLSADRKAEIQKLQYRVAELKSSIRNAKLAKKYQDSEAGSLDALIDKWRRVSQEAATYLVKHMVEDNHDDDFNSSSWTTSTVQSSPISNRYGVGWWNGQQGQKQDHRNIFGSRRTTETFCSASALSRDNSDDSQASAVGKETMNEGSYTSIKVNANEPRRIRAKSRAKMDLLREKMEYQDTVEDLPSVEEAVRLREYSGEDSCNERMLRRLPKMQRLLLGLKIDPDLLGYNAILDEFTEQARDG
ncbi:hypothetical protein BGW42_008391 [Actinomortierella wolfii]|nr:hypothetical protein BGW42_008391 [Actinomortierella wolfii]